MRAWADQVPFYVTSNPFIAKAYAAVAVRFIQDQARRGRLRRDAPVYVLELGAGPGKLAFHALSEIERLRHELDLDDVDIRYVMTDFTDRNVPFLFSHPALAPFVERGLLDFAVFDLERSSRIELSRSKETLEPNGTANPIIAFANYLFDSVRQDVFHVADGRLHEALVTLERPAPAGDEPPSLDGIEVSFERRPVEQPAYYGEPALDALLEHYRASLGTTDVTIPVGALRGIEALRALSGDRLLLIAGDKGYDRLEELDGLETAITTHGSISMSVNLHALGWLVERCGGEWRRPSPRDGLKTVVFLLGDSFAECRETRAAVSRELEGFGPADYFALHRQMKHLLAGCEPSFIVAYMNLCGWDPYVFHFCAARVRGCVGEVDATVLRSILDGARRLAKNLYDLPLAADVWLDIGLLFHQMSQLEEALGCYRRSVEIYGEGFLATFNAAVCRYGLGEPERALVLFRRALELDASADDARFWIARLERERRESPGLPPTVGPVMRNER